MASLALEEKINKIRLKNEEIKKRYEEVEADKKNAARLDALSEPVPYEDWPERKEPPEFSAPISKQARSKPSVRKHPEQPTPYYAGNEGKKTHVFPDGQGPPPDPKYNFLADSEREEQANEIPKDSDKIKTRGKPSRGGLKRRGSGRDWRAKEHWNQPENTIRGSSHPDYEAWRAERNRIDEARISRQRTAEGNWRREWDNDKIHLVDDVSKRDHRISLSEVPLRQEQNDKHFRHPRGNTRNSYPGITRESQPSIFSDVKDPVNVAENQKRVVIATEKNIKVLVNAQGSVPPRSSVMSIKVNSPNIAGTGRVGPRQRPRLTYSSQTETDIPIENHFLTRQKSLDESPRNRSFDEYKNTPPKSPRHIRQVDEKSIQKGKNVESIKSKRDGARNEETPKLLKKDLPKSPHAQKRANNPQKFSRVTKKYVGTKSDTLKYESQKDDDQVNSSDAIAGVNEENIEITNLKIENYEENCEDTSKEKMSLIDIEMGDDRNEKQILNNEVSDVLENCLETKQEQSNDEFSDNRLLESCTADIESDKKDSSIEHNESIDNAPENETESTEIIDNSANNELASNDSGFIEMSGNESTHDKSSENLEAEIADAENKLKDSLERKPENVQFMKINLDMDKENFPLKESQENCKTENSTDLQGISQSDKNEEEREKENESLKEIDQLIETGEKSMEAGPALKTEDEMIIIQEKLQEPEGGLSDSEKEFTESGEPTEISKVLEEQELPTSNSKNETSPVTETANSTVQERACE